MSTASPSCRIDWRPSRSLCGALLVLGLLGAVSVLLSDLSPAWRVLLAPASLLQGARLALREWRRAPCALEVSADGQASIGGDALASRRLRLRGVLASLDWRFADGRRGSLLWCADTLDAPTRRQLLLRLGGQSPA